MSYTEFQTEIHKQVNLIAVVESLSATTMIGDNQVTLRQVTHNDIHADTRTPYLGVVPVVELSARVVTNRGVKIDIVSLLSHPTVFKYSKSGARQPVSAKSIYNSLIADILAYYHSEQCRQDFATHEVNECAAQIAEHEAAIALLQRQKAKYEAIVKDVKER